MNGSECPKVHKCYFKNIILWGGHFEFCFVMCGYPICDKKHQDSLHMLPVTNYYELKLDEMNTGMTFYCNI